jgi:phage shock protein B
MNVGLVAVALAMSIPIVAIICGTITAIAKKPSNPRDDPEQTRMIQEIYQGLERMEKRVEALETILYDAGKDL